MRSDCHDDSFAGSGSVFNESRPFRIRHLYSIILAIIAKIILLTLDHYFGIIEIAYTDKGEAT
ncbi:MAG: hypothetical protein M2R45_00505 [Verrucomicrobia subdivision 3 bacterium]|nr:hypothetical protein [Limisphaerales bacterium]MCS1413617.1 hypothetical protein [Limisphaerales bacterium]